MLNSFVESFDLCWLAQDQVLLGFYWMKSLCWLPWKQALQGEKAEDPAEDEEPHGKGGATGRFFGSKAYHSTGRSRLLMFSVCEWEVCLVHFVWSRSEAASKKHIANATTRLWVNKNPWGPQVLVCFSLWVAFFDIATKQIKQLAGCWDPLTTSGGTVRPLTTRCWRKFPRQALTVEMGDGLWTQGGQGCQVLGKENLGLLAWSKHFTCKYLSANNFSFQVPHPWPSHRYLIFDDTAWFLTQRSQQQLGQTQQPWKQMRETPQSSSGNKLYFSLKQTKNLHFGVTGWQTPLKKQKN